MRYADAILLGRYARLQLEIVVAKNPTAKIDLSKDTVRKSIGYRKLRAWFMRMSPRKRADARRWLKLQCEGVEQIKKLCIHTGEDPSTVLADIEIVHRDDQGNEVEPLSLPDVRAAGDQE